MRVLVGAWIVGLGTFLSACAASERPIASPVGASESGADGADAPEGGADGRPTRARVEKAGRVTLGSFALAGRVTWASMTAVGETAAGLVQNGTGGAKDAWRQGTQATRAVAKKEADHVRALSRDETSE